MGSLLGGMFPPARGANVGVSNVTYTTGPFDGGASAGAQFVSREDFMSQLPSIFQTAMQQFPPPTHHQVPSAAAGTTTSSSSSIRSDSGSGSSGTSTGAASNTIPSTSVSGSERGSGSGDVVDDCLDDFEFD